MSIADVAASEYRQLCLFLKDQVGFALGIALYNLPGVRDAVIERAARDLAADRITVTQLDLTDTPHERMLLDRIKAHCRDIRRPAGHAHALMVTGIESALDFGSFPAEGLAGAGDGLALFGNANVQRDHFARVLDLPVVLWLSPSAEAAFARAAPDLWHWRKAFFDFSAPQEQAAPFEQAQIDMPLAESGSLGARHKHERLAVLKDALAREGSTVNSDRAASKARSMRLLNEIGLVYQALGQFEEALDYFKRMRTTAREADDEFGIASASGNMGNIMAACGDLESAETMYRESLTIHEKLGRRAGMAANYNSLGNLLDARGDLEGAEAMYRRALTLNEKLGWLQGMATAYVNLGNILAKRNDLEGAEAMYRKALVIEEKLGRPEGKADALGNFGSVMAARGDLDRAEAIYRESLAINEKLGRRGGVARDSANLASVLLARGNPEAAEQMRQKAAYANAARDRAGHAPGFDRARLPR